MWTTIKYCGFCYGWMNLTKYFIHVAIIVSEWNSSCSVVCVADACFRFTILSIVQPIDKTSSLCPLNSKNRNTLTQPPYIALGVLLGQQCHHHHYISTGYVSTILIIQTELNVVITILGASVWFVLKCVWARCRYGTSLRVWFPRCLLEVILYWQVLLGVWILSTVQNQEVPTSQRLFTYYNYGSFNLVREVGNMG